MDTHSSSQRIQVDTSTEAGILVLNVANAQIHGYSMSSVLQKRLMAALAENKECANVVLDLGSVRSLSSETFRPLITLRRKVQERGGELVLCKVAPNVASALQATRMLGSSSSASVFNMQPDMRSAIAHLQSAETHLR